MEKIIEKAVEELKHILSEATGETSLVELTVTNPQMLPLCHKALLECKPLFQEKNAFPVLILRDSLIETEAFALLALALSKAIDYLSDGDEMMAEFWRETVAQDAKTTLNNTPIDVLMDAIKKNFPMPSTVTGESSDEN